MAKESEWPRVKRNPDATYQNADGFQNSDRSVAGPLRFGTTRGVGPRGDAVAEGRDEDRSDMGMDRVSPREFDPMGTGLRRYQGATSELLSSRKRRE